MVWCVLNVSEAFWQIPLTPAGRKYFCARLTVEGKIQYIVCFRIVQGSLVPSPSLLGNACPAGLAWVLKA